MPRILFVNPNVEDYAADGVFHGLRSVLGRDAVDFPKAEYMYDTINPAVRGRLRGYGFTLYGLLPDIDIDRDHCLDRALNGEFDLVIFGDIWRTFGVFSEWGPPLADAGIPLAILDGSDRVEPYPYAGLWWRRRAWWFLPRAHNRGLHFKREITPWTRWFGSYLLLPPPLNRLRMRAMMPLAFSIPEETIVQNAQPKDQEFATHVVDPELAPMLGRGTTYAFSDESSYVADIRRSRFGITTKREGWDALRHYEIAAAGTVPCFRELGAKPETCAPHGLVDGINCLAYDSGDELLSRIGQLTPSDYSTIQAGALSWARANTTVARAAAVLASAGLDVSGETG